MHAASVRDGWKVKAGYKMLLLLCKLMFRKKALENVTSKTIVVFLLHIYGFALPLSLKIADQMPECQSLPEL